MPQPATTDELADYLVTGFWDAVGTPGAPFPIPTPDGNVITVDITALTTEGQALAREAFEAWEMVADIDFQETTGPADITFDDNRRGAYTDAGHVNVSNLWLWGYGTSVGTYAFQTYVHEIGHALGLGHAGAYNADGSTFDWATDAEFENDSWQQSVMSYFDQEANPTTGASLAFLVTPMMADIVAIQSLYGAPQGGATAGATTYGVGSNLGTYLDGVFGPGDGGLGVNAMTIYDEGGLDTIAFTDDAKAQRVDLAGGAFSDVYGLEGNLGIAEGTVIETYKAGSGNDSVAGNEAANTLKGNAGDDHLNGRTGADSLYGGDGRDALAGAEGGDRAWGGTGDDSLDGGAGDDRLYGEDGHDTLGGADGQDSLDGGTGLDKLLGGAGDDLLAGGDGSDKVKGDAGNDSLAGGAGEDAFTFTAGKDVVTDFEDGRDTILVDDALWGGVALSAQDVLDDYGRIKDGQVILDFGSGTKLVIDGIATLAALADDLGIV